MTEHSAPSPVASVGIPNRLATGTLSTGDIVFFVVAAAAPLMVVAGGSPLAFLIGGIGAPGSYVVAGIAYVLFALGFTAMAQHLPNTGAFYAFIKRGLSPSTGIAAAWVALASYSLICFGFYGALGFFAESTVNNLLGISVPWPIWSLAGVLVVGFIGYRQINIGARVLGILMAAEVLILVILAVAILIDGGPEGMSVAPFLPANVFAPGSGAMFVLALGAFLGFESTAIYSEEAREPRRSIPRATYISVGFLALFYGFATWIATVGFGANGILTVLAGDDFGTMYFMMANSYLGHAAQIVMEVLIVTSVFAAIIAFHNASTRYMFALGRERILPRRFALTHPTYKSPYIGSLVMSAFSAVAVIATLALAGDPYLHLLLWTNGVGIVGIVLLQILCAFAIIRFFWASRRGHSVFRVAIAPAASALLLSGGLYLMLANFELLTGLSGWINLALVAPLIVLGVVGFCYGWVTRADQSELDDETETEPVSG
ncbi:APC family permease [Leifsonia sp. YAF41]|uniref:APC family permease n=1 Tax=Leifsonia sp. YAF41 TaxID=3233086 RepID=UPI003F9BF8D9